MAQNEAVTFQCSGVTTTDSNEYMFKQTGASVYCSYGCLFNDACWGDLTTIGDCYCDSSIIVGDVCPAGTTRVTFTILSSNAEMFGEWTCSIEGSGLTTTASLTEFCKFNRFKIILIILFRWPMIIIIPDYNTGHNYICIISKNA